MSPAPPGRCPGAATCELEDMGRRTSLPPSAHTGSSPGPQSVSALGVPWAQQACLALLCPPLFADLEGTGSFYPSCSYKGTGLRPACQALAGKELPLTVPRKPSTVLGSLSLLVCMGLLCRPRGAARSLRLHHRLRPGLPPREVCDITPDLKGQRVSCLLGHSGALLPASKDSSAVGRPRKAQGRHPETSGGGRARRLEREEGSDPKFWSGAATALPSNLLQKV